MTKTLNEVIEYVNFHYYSKPFTVVNIDKLSLPWNSPLEEVRQGNHQFQIRISHGLSHVLAAMELIDDIEKAYREHVYRYAETVKEIANTFKIEEDELLKLIKIAILFQDAAREGDGANLWNEDSADACFKYLTQEYGSSPDLALLISDTIHYKDNEKEFDSLHDGNYFLRELVDTADRLEVMRTQDVFKPWHLPISKSVTSNTMRNEIIPKLVVCHRQKIIDEGRLAKTARISFPQYIDPGHNAKAEIDLSKIGKSYFEQCKKYDLSILHIDSKNLDMVFEKAVRGIDAYLEEHKESGFQWSHNGFFSPRYHGSAGRNRAENYKSWLSDEDRDSRIKVKMLYALLANKNGTTLKEAVLRSFNQTNCKHLLSQLKTMMKKQSQNINQLNSDIKSIIIHSEYKTIRVIK